MGRAPILAISLGDPAGIGPETLARALADPGAPDAFPVVYGARSLWARGCEAAGVPDRLSTVRSARDATGPSLVECDDVRPGEVPAGVATPRGGLAQARFLARAVDEVLSGAADGLVTAPVNKASLARAGFEFPGHTEYLQRRFGAARVVMMMAGERLRVALATTHLALRDVPAALDAGGVAETILLTASELERRLGVAHPRLAVCGLNPHAGEEGRFGDEEKRVVVPAIEAARARGVRVDGPFAADGLFPRAVQAGFDAVVAMYHDQGLVPFKMAEFAAGVNVTLGLPKPRTSPDHGVAYDLAGRGTADHRPTLAALRLCARMCREPDAQRG